ncbi:MAG: 1-acyl-sn-glycerol-3-phosphate acyltransferase, partial [Bacteroidales bacterium]|nr:1-acyl-sn-glycerol-3-phosphate acyltransferase [Bacteroidales bacterium]
MKELFLKIHDALSARRGLTAALLVVLLCICGGLVLRMHYEEDITAFLPTDQKSQKYSSVYNSLGGEDKIAVFFHMESDPDPDLISEAMDRFGEILSESDSTGLVGSAQITVDEASVYDVFDFIGENYPLFLQDEDFARMDSLLSVPGYIEEQMASNRRTLLLPSAGMMGTNIQYDPLGLFTPVLLRLQGLDPTGGSTIIDEHLFTADMTRGFAFVNSPFGTAESGMNSLLVELLDKTADKTILEYPDVRISSIGGPVIAVANSSQIKKDSILSVVIAMALILLVLYLSFKRFKDIFWIAFSIFCGAALAMGMIALFKDSISIIVLGIGSIIIGIAVNYPLHYIDHLKHQPDPREALKEMVSPLVVGNVTTVSAFAALFLLKAKALHDFGLVGALVLVGTIIFSMVFLPVFVRKREPARNTVRLDFDRHVTLTRGQRRLMLVLFVLLTSVLGYYGSRTSFDSDMHHINYMTADQARDLDLLSSLQGEDPSKVTVYGVGVSSDMESLLQNSESMLASVRGSQGVESVSSIGDFIPSLRRQNETIEKWNSFWENHPDVISRMNAAASENGFRQNAFALFTESARQGLEPLEYEEFEPIVDALGQTFILDGENGQKKIVNYINVKTDCAESLKAAWNASSPDEDTSFFFDSSDVGNQLVSLLSDDFNNVGFLCGFIVFFFLWVSFGSLELSLLSFLPLAVSWLWILGIMNLTGIQFNIVNIILATFIFGQGDDYTIFITEGLMYEYAYHKKILSSYKNSVAMSAIIMFIGIGALIISRHPAMKSLGQVTIIGMFTVVLMAYYLP